MNTEKVSPDEELSTEKRNVLVLFLVGLLCLGTGLCLLLWLAKGLYDQGLQQRAYDRHAHLISAARTLIHEHILKAVQDTHQLSAISCVKNYLTNPSEATRARLIETLVATSDIQARYDQIRLIDLEGQELVRVNQSPEGAQPAPQGALQNKFNRYYVQEGLKLSPGQVYLSPLDLNVEHGEIETPLKPTLRLVRMMSGEDGAARALLVLNFSAADMLNQLIELFAWGDRAMLVNSEGYWLVNHDPANEWGWLLGRPELNVEQWQPALWQQIQAQPAGVAQHAGSLFSFATINAADIYRDTSNARYLRDLGLITVLNELTWTILVESDRHHWQARAVYHRGWFQAGLAGLGVLLVLGWYFAAQNRQHRRYSRALRRQQLNVFRDLYENAPVGYVTLGEGGLITNVNVRLLEDLGYTREDLIGKRLIDLAPQAHRHEVEALLVSLDDGEGTQQRTRLKRGDGSQLEVLCNVSSSLPEQKTLQIGRCSVQDISRQAALEQCLRQLAERDPLTGLANRRFFDVLADREWERATRRDTPVVAMVMDIDFFKRVNDTHGHDVGDQVLKLLADTCSRELRATDILARFGGEEFVLLMPETTLEQGVQKADVLRALLARTPLLTASGEKVSFTVSLGVAVRSPRLQSLERLLKAADRALYRAKHSGRTRVCVDGEAE